jgi:hypothetical protein
LRNGSKWVEQITAMHGGYVRSMHVSDAEDHVAQRMCMANSTTSEGGQQWGIVPLDTIVSRAMCYLGMLELPGDLEAGDGIAKPE